MRGRPQPLGVGRDRKGRGLRGGSRGGEGWMREGGRGGLVYGRTRARGDGLDGAVRDPLPAPHCRQDLSMDMCVHTCLSWHGRGLGARGRPLIPAVRGRTPLCSLRRPAFCHAGPFSRRGWGLGRTSADPWTWAPTLFVDILFPRRGGWVLLCSPAGCPCRELPRG